MAAGPAGVPGRLEINGRWEYSLQCCLGRGGFATVYRGRDKVTKDRIAVKVMDFHDFSAEQVRVVSREVDMQAPFSRDGGRHMNVLPLLDSCQTGNQLCLVMPYMETSLHQLLRQGRLAGKPLRRLASDIFSALCELQYRGIVHRDLKPENMLLTSKDAMVAVLRIADFGLANDADSILRTQCGTDMYRAPEVLTRAGYTCASDIFSAGVVLWKMADGVGPFPDGDRLREWNKRNGRWAPGTADLPEACRQCVQRMLRPDPTDRPTVNEQREQRDRWFLECLEQRRERSTVSRDCGLHSPVPWEAPVVAEPHLSPARTLCQDDIHGGASVAVGGAAFPDLLCLQFDPQRGRLLLGTASGVTICSAAAGGDAAADGGYLRLRGGVCAVCAVQGGLSGAERGDVIAFAGGGQPAALAPGLLGLWDESGVRSYVRNGAEPVLSLSSSGSYLAAATATSVKLYQLADRASFSLVHELGTAANPSGAHALRSGLRGVCLAAPAPAGLVACVLAADGHVHERAVALSEPARVLAVDPSIAYVAATTTSGHDVYVAALQGADAPQPLWRGSRPSAVASLSFSVCSAFLSFASERTVHIWRRTATGFEKGCQATHGVATGLPVPTVFAGPREVWAYDIRARELRTLTFNRGDPCTCVAGGRVAAPAPLFADGPTMRFRAPPPLLVPDSSDSAGYRDERQELALLGRAEMPHLLRNDTAVPVGVVVRQHDTSLIPADPRDVALCLPHCWMRSIQPSGCVLQVTNRVGPPVVLRFPSEKGCLSAAHHLTKCKRSSERPLTPGGRLWLFVLTQARLAKRVARAEASASAADCVPAAAGGSCSADELRYAAGVLLSSSPEGLPRLGPHSLLHEVHDWIAGPRPSPLRPSMPAPSVVESVLSATRTLATACMSVSARTIYDVGCAAHSRLEYWRGRPET